MKKVILALPVIVALTGCGSDVDLVKSGVMEFNKTITLGQALDSWKSCKSSSWESFETDNGVKVVEFSCSHEIGDFWEKTKEIVSKENQSDTPHLDIVSNVQNFQFTINKDDTFQIDNVQVVNTWLDGTSFEDSQESVEQLRAAYNNDITFDSSQLNWMAARQLSSMFFRVKEKAK